MTMMEIATAGESRNKFVSSKHGPVIGLTVKRQDGSTLNLKGREAFALHELLNAGAIGCTPIDNPAPRWSHYVWLLRARALNVETINEPHKGAFAGTHARYAERAFSRLMKSGEMSLADLMTRTLAFAATWAARPKADLQFCPYPASWLNSGEYLDTTEPAVALNGNGGGLKIEAPRDPKSFTDGEWQDRLATFKSEGRWLQTFWGPPPGAPGCLVPAHLIGGA